MSFMLALPKISLHGAGAIGDMVNLVAAKQWGKALIVTDGQLVKLGLLDSLFAALDAEGAAALGRPEQGTGPFGGSAVREATNVGANHHA